MLMYQIMISVGFLSLNLEIYQVDQDVTVVRVLAAFSLGCLVYWTVDLKGCLLSRNFAGLVVYSWTEKVSSFHR